MGVERVDYYSDEEFEQALAQEAQPQAPDIVPCFKCGCQMYQECHDPSGNVCNKCNDLKGGE